MVGISVFIYERNDLVNLVYFDFSIEKHRKMKNSALRAFGGDAKKNVQTNILGAILTKRYIFNVYCFSSSSPSLFCLLGSKD